MTQPDWPSAMLHRNFSLSQPFRTLSQVPAFPLNSSMQSVSGSLPGGGMGIEPRTSSTTAAVTHLFLAMAERDRGSVRSREIWKKSRVLIRRAGWSHSGCSKKDFPQSRQR